MSAPLRAMKFKILPAVMVLLLAGLGTFLGMLLPVLGLRFSLLGFGSLIVLVGLVVVMLLPNRKVVPYGLIFFVFGAAVVTRFLWPNFAYLPIPALPIKNPQRLVWALALAYWLYSLATNRELRERLARRVSQPGLAWLIFMFFAWRMLSVPFSEYPGVGTYLMLRELFDYLPAFLFVLTWVRGADDAVRVGRWLLAATFVICILAIAEYIGKRNLFLSVIPYDPNNEDFLRSALESKIRGGVYRVQASFNHPLLLAQFLSVTLPVLMLTTWSDHSRFVRLAGWGVMLVLPGVLWATQTRTALGVSAFIGASAVLLMTLYSIRRREVGTDRHSMQAAILLMFLAALGAAIIAFAVQLALGRTSEETSSSQARVEMLERAVKGMQDQPLIGDGPGVGGFEAANINSRGRVSLDSYWLLVLLESGLPALMLYLAMLIAGVRHLVPAVSRGLHGEARIQAAWALAIASFAISSSVLGTPHNLPLLYLALGIVVALDDSRRQRTRAASAAAVIATSGVAG